MQIPLNVSKDYGLATDAESAAKLEAVLIPSLINRTYIVRAPHMPRPLVLQCMHPVFGAHVHVDIQAVTLHLEAQRFETPLLIPTLSGALWTTDSASGEGRVWRALTYVDGVTFHKSGDPELLSSAADLLARFHGALTGLSHRFVHSRPLHDTRRHLANLETALASSRAAGDAEAQQLGADILRASARLAFSFEGCPKRVMHGDPKLSNVLFHRATPPRARCMIDLDSLGPGLLAYELGDALRSWCNPTGEDTASPRLDVRAFEAVLRGYARARPASVTREELASVVEGLETVSLELASRFAADVINDSYFGWDTERFASRRDHNLLRARGQLALSLDVQRQRGELLEIAERTFDGA